MIPRPSQGLADIAAKLAADIAPATRSAFAMASTGMISMLLTALATESERAVASRMADLEELRSLFDSVDDGADPDNAAARAAFGAKRPASLAVSDVEALHAEGMALLIPLHAWAEEADPQLDRQIWEFLLRHTERHKLDG